jgi:hypothetical protein
MNWKSKGLVAIGVSSLFLGAILYSCGGGGGDGGGGSGGTQIQSVEEGAAAAGAGTAGALAGGTISDIASNLGNLTNNALTKPVLLKPTNPLVSRSPRHAKMVAMTKKVAESGVIQKAVASLKAAKSRTALVDIPGSGIPSECQDGGFATFTGTIDEFTGDFDIDIDCDQCKKDAGELDGPIQLTGKTTLTEFEFTMNLGDETTDFSVLTYTDNTYTELLEDFSSTLDFIQTFAFDLIAQIITGFTLEIDGSATFTDFTTDEETTIEVTNFKDEGSIAGLDDEGNCPGTCEFDDTLNGNLEESWTDTEGPHTVLVDFNNFNSHVEASGLFVAKTALTHGDPDGEADISYSGGVRIVFTPEEDCEAGGTFNFETVEPLHIGYNDSCPLSGHLVINNAVDVTFDAGSVVVEFGDDLQTFASCEDVEDLCEVEDLE